MNKELLRFWTLDSGVAYLNHGSFGAVLSVVQEHQNELRRRMEEQPYDFMVRQLRPALAEARSSLASFLGSSPNDLVFVNNATEGVNSVLRSFPWKPGDRILVTDHEYQACRNAVDFVAGQFGLEVDVAEIPFPLISPDIVVDQVLGLVSPQTRLVLLDHVTSPTALILPIERLISALRSDGIQVLIDGAHAPGMLSLNLNHLGADYYTGNCHKWMCSPRGAGFLWVREERQEEVRPVSISHGASEDSPEITRFIEEFSWKGTDDPTAWLCVPAAIAALDSLASGGWPDIMQANRQLALEARDILCTALSIAPPAPDSMIGSMASIPLPPGDPELFYKQLLSLGIEVPVFNWNHSRILRISAQIYNTREDYETLSQNMMLASGGDFV
ncbi:MAG: aminotransferase class V-fold PLP-dependent enzyme [Planctomycetota bacterium]|nr:aminotransferase class V-fold PLP-dependent enzyme [Planctomycetota bacterium]MDP6940657.1 aminotransferase class V-fold PLP-dependent enzyme [Planctomycetota bacterium]